VAAVAEAVVVGAGVMEGWRAGGLGGWGAVEAGGAAAEAMGLAEAGVGRRRGRSGRRSAGARQPAAIAPGSNLNSPKNLTYIDLDFLSKVKPFYILYCNINI
jgi:hypothetical protein